MPVSPDAPASGGQGDSRASADASGQAEQRELNPTYYICWYQAVAGQGVFALAGLTEPGVGTIPSGSANLPRLRNGPIGYRPHSRWLRRS